MTTKTATPTITTEQALEIGRAIRAGEKTEREQAALDDFLRKNERHVVGLKGAGHYLYGGEPKQPGIRGWCTEMCPPASSALGKSWIYPGSIRLFHATCKKPTPVEHWTHLAQEQAAEVVDQELLSRFLDEAKSPADAAARFLGAVDADCARKKAEIEGMRRALEQAEAFLSDGLKLKESASAASRAAGERAEEWIAQSGRSKEALLAATELAFREPPPEPVRAPRAFTSRDVSPLSLAEVSGVRSPIGVTS